MTVILNTNDPLCITTASRMLAENEIIAFPTDTVYGIGVSLNSRQAIDKLYQVKTRSIQKPIAVLIGDMDQLFLVAETFPSIAKKLASKYWPGALTLVVPKRNGLPDNLSSFPTIGVRMPDHKFILELLKCVGPLATTSANISGQIDSLSSSDVLDQLGENIRLIIDGGKTSGGIPSTVVDCSQQDPVILRVGSISGGEIFNLIEKGID